MSHLVIPLDVWATKCHVFFWPEDLESRLRQLDFDKDDIEELMEDDSRAMMMMNNSNEAVILLCEKMGGAELAAVVAHEALHATGDILENRGVRWTHEDANESFAYTLEYIVYKTLDYFNANPTL